MLNAAHIFSSPSGDGVISGHADGKIVRYTFQEEHSRVSGGSMYNLCEFQLNVM